MDFIISILETRILLQIGALLTVPLSIIFIYLYFNKSGRDERGRGIFATACFIAICVYLVIINVTSVLSDEHFSSPQIVKSLLVHTYNIVLLTHLGATLILRKIR